MNQGFCIDWLTVTFDYGINVTGLLGPSQAECKAVPPYTSAVRDQYGAIVCWHEQRPELRVMLRISGEALSNMRKNGIAEEIILRDVIENKGRVTRIDFATDVFDCGGGVVEVFENWKHGETKTPAQSVTLIDGKNAKRKDKGTTLYFGSRKSERFVRIYDKGKQQKTKLDWMRVEIEMKGKRAKQMAEHMHNEGVKNAGMSHLREVITDTSVGWLKEALECEYEQIDIDSIGRPETNHERWLYDVVLPAVREALDVYGSFFEDRIVAALEDYREKGSHGPSLSPWKSEWDWRVED